MKSLRHWGVHLARVAMLICILFVMHLQHDRILNSQRALSLSNIEFSKLQAFFPDSERWGDAERHGGRQVLSSGGETLGYVIQTAPESDRFLGFSGPTNLLVAFNIREQIVGIQVIESRDTRDHVDLILKSDHFFQSWIGLSWTEAASRTKIDGVSGATLTSLAMIQGLQKRLGAPEVSLKFPKPLELKDAVQFFPNAVRIEQDPSFKAFWRAFDASLKLCGAILRTSPAADELVGYQGPTETRLALAMDGSIVGIAIADSFDNEPYVGYARGDAYFAKLLKKYTIREWSQIDVEQAGIEGVSGATMTSLAVANGIVETAKRYESHLQEGQANRETKIAGLWRGASTIAIIAVGLLIGLTSLRGRNVVRIAFQVVVIVYLGLINGDLLSLAMFHGWSQNGIPWQNALGLVSLATAAFVLPIVARTNIYCSHLCPHGAVQQLLPRRWKQKTPIPRSITRWLLWIRPLLLAWVVLVGLLHLPFSLVDIEPFDAYAWRAAAWPTVLVAVVGIAASLRVPMAYCRFGCGTGAILQYVRRHSQSDRLTRADLFAAICLAFGGLVYWMGVDW